jgi:hypothetical protein
VYADYAARTFETPSGGVKAKKKKKRVERSFVRAAINAPNAKELATVFEIMCASVCTYYDRGGELKKKKKVGRY